MRKIYEWFMDDPRRCGKLLGAFALPYALTKFYRIWVGIDQGEDPLLSTVKVASPFWLYCGGLVATVMVDAFTKDGEKVKRTRLTDYFTIRKLNEKIARITAPEVKLQGKRKVTFSSKDWLMFLFYREFKENYIGQVLDSKNPALALSAAVKYFGAKKYDRALDIVRAASDWLGSDEPELSVSSKVFFNLLRISALMGRNIQTKSEEMWIFSMLTSQFVNAQASWYYSSMGRAVADEFGTYFRKEMYVFHALLASAQRRSDEDVAWADAVRVVREGAQWRKIGDRTVVRVVGNNDFFANTFVFKEKGSLESLVREANACRVLAERVPEVVVPQVLHVTKEPVDGRYCLVMRYLAGETLYDRLKGGDSSRLEDAVVALAKMHACFPVDGLPRLDICKKLSEKLADAHFGIPQSLAERVKQNYAQVFEAVSDLPWVWNKDAHPENWIVGEKLGVIDCEVEYVVPALFDVANLLEYGDFLSREEKRKRVLQYSVELKKEGLEIERGTLFRAYHNAVIHRMISLAGAWSAPQRELRSERAGALDRAVKSIEYVKEDDARYYALHKEKYEGLSAALVQMRELMGS